MTTIFNPEKKDKLTYGECLGPAMKITDPADATQYLKAYAFIQVALDRGEGNRGGKTAEQIAKSNLGYYAGYYDNETRERVERLFNCNHPIFGAIAEKAPPTPEEAFEMGRKMGAARKRSR
jgi:hypothetical protein